MCQRITCKTCQKPSWRGCGAHVESVLGDVAPADRCNCAATATPKAGRFGRLLGR
jgi:hypothetical protein